MSFVAGDVQPFFFEAMKKGFAQGSTKSKVVYFPSSKIITFERGHFRLVDHWFTTLCSRKSFGTTIIYAMDNPVWMMHYWGWYAERVIHFLMRALMSEYSQDFVAGGDPQFFNGCRGPRLLSDGGLFYINVPDHGSDFTSFSGREQILDNEREGGLSCGWHMYHGFSLL
jgi:hypothetical protein